MYFGLLQYLYIPQMVLWLSFTSHTDMGAFSSLLFVHTNFITSFSSAFLDSWYTLTLLTKHMTKKHIVSTKRFAPFKVSSNLYHSFWNKKKKNTCFSESSSWLLRSWIWACNDENAHYDKPALQLLHLKPIPG